MAVFKCKICGAKLEVQEGMSICECEYCGSAQTISMHDEEKRIILSSHELSDSALVQRGYMALEDQEWGIADQFFEEALNIDPQNATAYMGKALAYEKCSTLEAFIKKREFLTKIVESKTIRIQPSEEYRRHIREKVEQYYIANYIEASEIEALYNFDFVYQSELEIRKEHLRCEAANWSNHKMLTRAFQFANVWEREKLEDAKQRLFAILKLRVVEAEAQEKASRNKMKEEYQLHLKEADSFAEKLYDKACKERDAFYKKLLKDIVDAEKKRDTVELTNIAQAFELLNEYKDCRAQVTRCRNIIDKINTGNRRRKIIMVCVCCAAIGLLGAFLSYYNKVIYPTDQYKTADELIKSGEYESAMLILEELEDYKDSKSRYVEAQELLKEENYSIAKAEFVKGNFKNAIGLLENLGDYKDAKELKVEVLYAYAVELDQIGEFSAAKDIFEELEDYLDAVERVAKMEEELVTNNLSMVAGNAMNTYAIDSEGELLICGYPQDEAIGWSNLISVAARGTNAIALKKDGTVYMLSKHIPDWTDIVTVSMDENNYYGVKKDGTVMHRGSGGEGTSDWTDVVAIASSHPSAIGLTKDGRVIATWRPVDEPIWENIVSISAGGGFYAALTANGTVKTYGSHLNGACEVDDWEDIVAISCGEDYTLGLKADGTVLLAGIITKSNNVYRIPKEVDVSEWTDIVAIEAGETHAIGLKRDGTMLVVGDNNFKKCSFENLRNIK